MRLVAWDIIWVILNPRKKSDCSEVFRSRFKDDCN